MSGMFGIATPHRRDKVQNEGSEMGISFDEVESFVEPAPRQQGQKARAPLRALSDNPLKASEFTPILRTASKRNRLLRYETPGQRSDKSTTNIMDNSALTPVNWTNKNHAQEESSALLEEHGRLSPAITDIHAGAGGIREQEKAMDKMKTENWELKLKLFLMEKQMFQSSPEHVQLALKENIDYKVQVTSLSKDLTRYKNALLETQKKVATLGDQVSASLTAEECQLQHGMSGDEREALRALKEERDDLLSAKEDLEMHCRELEDDNDELTQLREDNRQAQDALEESQKELATMNARLEALVSDSEDNQAWQRKAHELEERVRELNDEHETLLSLRGNDAVILAKDKVIAQLKSETEQLQSKLSTSEQQNQTLSSRIHLLETRNDSLEADIEERSQERVDTHDNHEQLELAKGNLEIKVASLTEENEKLRSHLEDLEQRTSELQEEVREREEDIEELRGAAEDQSFEYRQLEDKMQAKRDLDIEQSRQAISELEGQITQAQLSNREDQRAMSRLKEQINTLEQRLADADERDSSKDKAIAEYRETITSSKAQLQTAERDAVALQQKINSLSARSQELEHHLREIESNGDPDTTQVQDRLRDENQELRETIEELEMQVRDSEEELDRVNEDVLRMRSELTEIRQETSEGTVLLESYKQQLDGTKTQAGELRRLLQASEDKAIMNEDARSKLQQDLNEAKQTISQQSQQIEAVNTSLLNVRKRLQEAQVTHKSEIQAISDIRKSENSTTASRCADLEARLEVQVSTSARALEEARAVRTTLEGTIEEYRKQVLNMEASIKQFSDNEETINIDHRHFKEALNAEIQRHVQAEEVMQKQIRDLETIKIGLKEQLEVKHSEVDNLASANRTIAQSNAEHEQVISQLRLRNVSTEAELIKSTRSVEAIEKENDRLQNNISSLDAKIAALTEALSSSRREHRDELLKRSDELFAESQKTQEALENLSAAESKCLQGEQERKRLVLNLASADQRLMASSQQINALQKEKEILTANMQSQLTVLSEGLPAIADESGVREELANVKVLLRTSELQLAEIAAERDLLQAQIEEVTTANVKYREETAESLKQLREDLALTQSGLKKERESLNSVEAFKDSQLKEHKAAATKEQNALKAIIADLQENLAIAKQNHAALLSNMGSASNTSAVDTVIRNLETEVSALKTRNQQIQEELSGNNEVIGLINQLESQITELEEDLEASQADVQSCQSKYKSQLAEETQKYQQDLDRLEAENDQLHSDLLAAQAKAADLVAAQEDLKSQMHAQSQTTVMTGHRTSKSTGRATEISEQSRRDTEEIRRQLDQSRNDLKIQKGLVADLKVDLSRARKSDASLQEELGATVRNVKKLENEVTAKERKLEDYKTIARQKSEQANALEQRLQKLVLSTSRPTTDTSSRTLDKYRAQHNSEIAGLTKILQYLRTKTTREELFRSDLAYIKSYYDKQIASFQACNQANLKIIEQIGITPDETYRRRKATFKSAAHLVISTIRMRKSAHAWARSKANKEKIESAMRARRD